ncbi:10 kDa heat shock protein [Meristemomyces frigidus]|uniref:10 kDa heat shock protein n=1 Tax=Meristemomyces frigidus TaxID=1508187 RepID=A0AAN7TVZ4_9PEZI|nr:10 kDa heat shock protein [Meristemomyces frigidus]
MTAALRSIKSLAPLLDRILVQRVKADAKTAGGIFLPESAQKELNQANVLAVGPGALDKKGNRLPMGVQVGDKVLIPQYGGSPIKVGEDEYSLFRDSEILAKINDISGATWASVAVNYAFLLECGIEDGFESKLFGRYSIKKDEDNASEGDGEDRFTTSKDF